jgi:hypothetical protein
MLVIIEGCDAAGKTTLKNELISRYNFIESVPKSLPTNKTDHTMCAENATAINLALEQGNHVVMDRSWLSEAIYSPILRGIDGRFKPFQLRMLERMAMTAGAVIVHCDPGWPEVRKNWLERGDEHITSIEMLWSIYNEYRRMASTTDLPVYNYNYLQHKSLSSWFDKLSAKCIAPADRVYGSSCASVLVVCAQPPREGDLPFISWRSDSMPAKITRAFDRAGVPEHQLAWTYAKSERLRRIVHDGQYTEVCYIGSDLTLDVELSCDKLAVDTWFLPLPSGEISYRNNLPRWLVGLESTHA